MNYLSVCSGIEAATVAWHPLGWTPFGFAEIEKFPSAVLAHHYGSNMPDELWKLSNGVPNFGDINNFKEWPDAPDLSILVGGTPCQSFSVAGLRKGLADPRGNLCLTYLAIADRYRPEWLVWENVPGVLSSNGGRDFGAFIGGLEQLGYHASWRVLGAQYVRVDGFNRAVPQRRRRVFVVGHLGDWRRAAAVLFERESLQGHNPPRRKSGQGVAPTISARPTGGGGLGTDFDCDGGLIAFGIKEHGQDASSEGVSPATRAMPPFGGGMLAVAFQPRFARNDRGAPDVIASALTSEAGRTGKGDSARCVAYSIQERAVCENPEAGPQDWAVRRLMPLECERLQGFPDGYTDIPFRNKSAADDPRYKALGNSMAVNAMRWLGRRIELVNRITQ